MHLEADIGVPSNAVGTLFEIVCGCGVTGTAVDEMDTWEALRCATGLMDMAGPVVFGKVKSVLDGKVGKILGAEGYYSLLCNEKSEFVLSGTVELAELHASDFGTNVGSKILDDSVALQQVWELWVGILAVLVGIESLVWWVFRLVPV